MSSAPGLPSSGVQKGEVTTRTRLLRTAEALFAEHGIAQTSTRAILRAAQQRNESALQYHFGGRDGLIEALYTERGAQVAAERELLLAELEEGADVRRVCEVAFLPPIRVAQRDPGFVLFLQVIGQLAFQPSETLQRAGSRYEGDGILEIRRRLEPLLDLPPSILQRRFEIMHRMAAIALSQRAMSGGSFEGAEADLYVDTQLDAMAAVLQGPVSESTTERRRRALESERSNGDEVNADSPPGANPPSKSRHQRGTQPSRNAARARKERS